MVVMCNLLLHTTFSLRLSESFRISHRPQTTEPQSCDTPTPIFYASFEHPPPALPPSLGILGVRCNTALLVNTSDTELTPYMFVYTFFICQSCFVSFLYRLVPMPHASCFLLSISQKVYTFGNNIFYSLSNYLSLYLIFRYHQRQQNTFHIC